MSFWRLYYHLIWATKNRLPFINAAIEPQLYNYLRNVAGELGVYVYAINGTIDHVHMVVAIPPKHAVATVVKHLKGASSHYLNHTFEFGDNFAWQRGYGAMSMGER